ncbi:MAG TPA: ATP-binding protein [Longimicrobiales bacterium]
MSMERPGIGPSRRPTARSVWLAVLAAVAASVVTHLLLPILAANIFLLFLLAVLVSSLYGGLVPGLITTLLSCVGAGIVVFEPRGLPWIAAPLDFARLATLGVFGIVIASLAEALRGARERARERELEARLGEESFRSIFDHSADAIYVANALGDLVNVNEAAARLHGEPREALIGRNWQSFVDAERSDLAQVRHQVEEAFRGRSRTYEVYVTTHGGQSVPLEMHVTAARYFGRDVLIAVARDLTERRRLEAELRQSQKMEAIGRLAGGIAHDFNNLLTSIRGYASLMRDRVTHDPTLLDDIAEIERAVDLATAVTRQLLAFSRKQDYVPRAISLNDPLDRIQALLRRLLDERIELAVERDPRLGRTLLDEGQFEQVVMNLVVNARDALAGSRGRIVLRTFDADRDGVPHVALSVSDNGVGMSEDLRARIFEPFFTTKEAGHGTGLGLSTVYGIVQQAGGSVDVESAPGHGSKFTAYFPRVSATPLPAEAPVQQPVVVAGDGMRTVLLAEDEPPVRRLVQRVLTRRGYHVIEAGNGREALDVARAHPGSIDALVTDVVMPEMTGPELAEALRADHPGLPVLFTSGYNEDGMEGTGVVSGLGIAFLQKPFVPDDLVRLLTELLGSEKA